MGRPNILDQKLMSKIAKKIGKKDIRAINVMVSQKASKLGISAEAALIILAKEHDVGVATFQRRLDPSKQAEVRDSLPTIFTSEAKPLNNHKPANKKARPSSNRRALLKGAIEYLIQDNELRDRCSDILLSPSKFDRPINQATLVLEDRIRRKEPPPKKLVGVELVNYAFKGDLSKTILKVSDNADEQDGFTNILRGVMLAFRNLTHHHITNQFTREEAMRVCGFIDVLLRVVDNSEKIR